MREHCSDVVVAVAVVVVVVSFSLRHHDCCSYVSGAWRCIVCDQRLCCLLRTHPRARHTSIRWEQHYTSVSSRSQRVNPRTNPKSKPQNPNPKLLISKPKPPDPQTPNALQISESLPVDEKYFPFQELSTPSASSSSSTAASSLQPRLLSKAELRHLQEWQ